MKQKIRLGSRDSRLAVIQTQLVMDKLHQLYPEMELELVTMKTTGDLILDRTLDKIGGKGQFVRELDAALLDGRVDLTVHSFKDLPMELPEELPIVAVTCRDDPRDALVLPQGQQSLDLTRPIGCASKRRALQLKELFPGCRVEPVRGNVQTRLKKLDDGQYGALVLAAAGLRRLGLEERIHRLFEPEELLPAACQGVLAVQARRDFDVSFLRPLHDPEAELLTRAERSFVRTLDGGCSAPVAAHGRLNGETLTLTGFYAGPEDERGIKQTLSGPALEGEELGRRLAELIRKEAEACV
ncbi:hydroxymethylbilane synthase [Angelakisella massiliensis]|uniref:hydroxymethylbilane synthase n=1 Tax=Angelakisella massiliensis TaxID=1871018 RepID=UPI0024B0F6A0|nr:hydroxymethylbilane synthase [Angelakisella massiliensis]